MIEVILRDDITEYKPRHFFGMTTRQAAVLGVAGVAALLEGVAFYMLLGLPLQVGGIFIVATAAAVTFLGLGKKDGVYMTRQIVPMIRYYLRPDTAAHVMPEVVLPSREGEPLTLERQLARRRDLVEAVHETEFCDGEGRCVDRAEAAKALGADVPPAVMRAMEKAARKGSRYVGVPPVQRDARLRGAALLFGCLSCAAWAALAAAATCLVLCPAWGEAAARAVSQAAGPGAAGALCSAPASHGALLAAALASPLLWSVPLCAHVASVRSGASRNTTAFALAALVLLSPASGIALLASTKDKALAPPCGGQAREEAKHVEEA